MNKISSISVLALMSLLVSCKVPESKAWVVISTLAGSTLGHVDATGTAAKFNQPTGVAVDSSGNVYVADRRNHRIRKITPAGVVSTLAGSTLGHVDATGTAAKFDYPRGVAVDSSGNVYVADTGNHRIRKITPERVVSTFAGNGVRGFADGTTTARFDYPDGVAVDSSGTVYVTDTGNNRIRKITPAEVVTTLAGGGRSDDGAGNTDGIGTAVHFYQPYGVAVNSSGNVYVADSNNHRIRKITPTGVVSTLAGSTEGFANGAGTEARFDDPYGVAVDSSGNVYVADFSNHRIRKITPAGVVTTLAGSTRGHTDATGTAAKFNHPYGVAVDSSGNVYVADSFNHRIRKITPAGVVTTLAGSTRGFADGTGTAAKFNQPTHVAVDSEDNVYVADRDNNSIRKIEYKVP